MANSRSPNDKYNESGYADGTAYISQHYYKACFQVRNEWMVDRVSRVIAAYNGTKGGTKNTIEYANRKEIFVENILD